MLYSVGRVEETQTEGSLLLLPVIHDSQGKAIVQPWSDLHSVQRPSSKSYCYKRGLRSTLTLQLCRTAVLLLQADTEKRTRTLSLASFVHLMAEWPAVFERRGNLSLATWNQSYIESEDEVENDDDQTDNQIREEEEEEDQADRDEEGNENEIRRFMRAGQVRVGCLAQADIVADFCAENRKAAIQKNAWLDERSCEGARSDPGPLTWLELYDKLKKPVSYPKSRFCSTSGGG